MIMAKASVTVDMLNVSTWPVLPLAASMLVITLLYSVVRFVRYRTLFEVYVSPSSSMSSPINALSVRAA